MKGDFEIYANVDPNGDLWLLDEVGRWILNDGIVNDWDKFDYGDFRWNI